ncbi:hypothetical protein Neosp_014961 [[Neocosmospora] mangrovei]
MEATGLVLGALGISGLFTACIQNFDIVVKSRHFGQEFDLLCTQLALQRVRLVLWGEALGLIPDPTGSKIPYNKAIERGDIRPAIESTLNHLHLLLQNAEVVTDRYELEDGAEDVKDLQAASSAGLTIFRERFDSFKMRIRRNQKTKSTWAVTRWAVHDSVKFRAMIGNIKDLVDGLDSITSTLGVLGRQQALLTEEIESISDTRSLRLLQEVASSDGTSPSLRIVSDAASIRLSFAESSISSQANRSRMTGSSRSYHTAPSQGPERSSLPALGEEFPVLDSSRDTRGWPPLARMNFRWPLHDHTEARGQHPPPSLSLMDQTNPGEKADENDKLEPKSAPSVEDIPQNQRLMGSLISKASLVLPELKFDSGSLHYGEALTAIKRCDEDIWIQKSPSLLLSADKGESAARRVFLELRSIRNAGVPFVSAAPVGDSLDKVLASIEGPPDTPMKGSWFSGSSSNRYSLGALLTALCGLLACPNVEDPLVPEIAATYITDYESYCEAARQYTQRYATSHPPSTETMDFEDLVSLAGVQTRGTGPSTISPSALDTFYAGSVRRSTLSTSEHVSDGDTASTKSKAHTARLRFLPTGEGRELRQRSADSDEFQSPTPPSLLKSGSHSSESRLERKIELEPRPEPKLEPYLSARRERYNRLLEMLTGRPKNFGLFPYTDKELNDLSLLSWTAEMVAQAMLDAGIEPSVVELFIENDVSGAILMMLRFEDLKELKISSFGIRTKVWHQIQALKDNQLASPRPPILREARRQEDNMLERRQSSRGVYMIGPLRYDITPKGPVSVVEEGIPKPHRCSKGENCSKWKR